MREGREGGGGGESNRSPSPSPSPFVLVAVCSLAACGGVTATGGPSLLAPRFSEAQEVRAGQRAARDVSRTLGLVANQALQDYVQQVGTRLAEVSERGHLPWTFRVVDDPMPNAFALPGGFVFVTRGLLGVVNSEAELAGVLAHAIGHVNARHGVQGLGRHGVPELGVWAVPAAELRSPDSASGGGLLFAEHTVERERQADDLAFRYIGGVGYNAREAAEIFAILGRVDVIGGRSALPSWPTSHPDPGDRAVLATQQTAALREPVEAPREGRVEYLARIEDLVYGADPRQGYWRGATFVHPELRFRLQLPAGWQYRNVSQAVVATSAGRDAAIQLTILEQVSPAEAAEQFVGQPGIRPAGGVATETVSGLPAAVIAFRAVTGAGPSTGTASWISYGGRTYQLVGVAAGQAANGYAEEFRAVLRTFGPVTDARLLDVKPNRINIVRLGRPTTLEEFNRRYPSVVDAREVALLNRLSGPAARLRAGLWVKRIVRG